jgi:hypothetical protein
MEGAPESDAEDNVKAVAAVAERRRAPAKRKRTVDTDTEGEEETPAAVPRKKGGKARKKRDPSPDSDSDSRTTSRHRPVTNSTIYNTHDGPIFTDVRRRFQTLIFVRDGFPLKTLTVHRHLNYKLALTAARDVMEPKLYRDFKNAMDIAYKDTSKE